MRNPTLEDVARLAGVSRATVSRVVRGDPLVAPAKVKIVQDAVRELGYVPNPAARSLVTRRTDAIALLIPEPDSRVFSDPFFASAIAGVNAALADTHLQLMLVMSSKEGDNTRLRRFLGDRHADGLVVLSYHEDPLLSDLLARLTVPKVFVGRTPEGVKAPYVDVDNVSGARLATEHLIRRGCRHIATIAGPQDMASGRDRLRGWREALEAHGLPTDLVAHGDFTVEAGGPAVADLLEHHPQIDAIFAANDLMALGAQRRLEQLGKRIPADIALVGYDDTTLGQMAAVPLTSVTNPVRELAHRATRLLVELVERPKTASKEPVVVTPDLKVRDSA